MTSRYVTVALPLSQIENAAGPFDCRCSQRSSKARAVQGLWLRSGVAVSLLVSGLVLEILITFYGEISVKLMQSVSVHTVSVLAH